MKDFRKSARAFLRLRTAILTLTQITHRETASPCTTKIHTVFLSRTLCKRNSERMRGATFLLLELQTGATSKQEPVFSSCTKQVASSFSFPLFRSEALRPKIKLPVRNYYQWYSFEVSPFCSCHIHQRYVFINLRHNYASVRP